MTITETQQTSFKRSRSDDPKMEYAWLEPKHDPIATDTNLAEIDFEDFRNEDLAYAFSTGVSVLYFCNMDVNCRKIGPFFSLSISKHWHV